MYVRVRCVPWCFLLLSLVIACPETQATGGAGASGKPGAKPTRKTAASTASIPSHVRGMLLLVTAAARPALRTLVPSVLSCVDRTHPSGTVGPVAPVAAAVLLAACASFDSSKGELPSSRTAVRGMGMRQCDGGVWCACVRVWVYGCVRVCVCGCVGVCAKEYGVRIMSILSSRSCCGPLRAVGVFRQRWCGA